jgi:leader peptidase (prepilin peptidase)/N-methyltransferase
MNALLDPESAVLAGVAFAFGLVVGSFLNVVIHRVPRGESVVSPRSRCPDCGHAIGALENVPIVSWIVLRGRCRGCGARISLRYPTVEALTGVAFAAIAVSNGAVPATVALCVFAALLIAAAGIDFDHQWIPDEVSLGGLVAGLVGSGAVAWLDGADVRAALTASAVGAGVGFFSLWSVGFFHARLSVALGRAFPHWPGEGESPPSFPSLDWWTWFPGMGFGDVKLAAMIGAFLGPRGVIEAIVLSAVAGLVLGVAWMAWRRDASAPFGFGPALALGAIAAAVLPSWLSVPW